jgi:radical SAM protein with 4Fe4S-binding SPASM domain
LNVIINVDGEVTPCCYWTTYGNIGKAIGNVNNNTIEEIWNSDGFVSLREKIWTDPTGLPCQDCMAMKTGGGAEAFIKVYYEDDIDLQADTPAMRNLKQSYDEYEHQVAKVDCLPTSLTMVSTAACNIDCTFCNQTPQRVAHLRLGNDIVDGILTIAPRLTHLAWQGGEAFLDVRFKKFVQNFNRDINPDLELHLVTNGMAAEGEFFDQCLEKFRKTYVTFSVDSFKKETYERLRRGSSYDRVMTNLNYAISVAARTSNLSVGVQACVMKSNILELSDNVTAAAAAGVGSYLLSPVLAWPPSEALNCFSRFSEETKGWREELESALALLEQRSGKSEALSLNAEMSIREILHVVVELGARYQDVIRLKVVVAALSADQLRGEWPVTQWTELAAGRFGATVPVDIPTCNLVGFEFGVAQDGVDIVNFSKTPTGRYTATGTLKEGRAVIVAALEAVPGFDPRRGEHRYTVHLRRAAEGCRPRRHGGSILAIFRDMDNMPPPVAYLPIDAPGTYFVEIPRDVAGNMLGCSLIDDEAAYYSAGVRQAVIQRDEDGAPVIIIHIPETI